MATKPWLRFVRQYKRPLEVARTAKEVLQHKDPDIPDWVGDNQKTLRIIAYESKDGIRLIADIGLFDPNNLFRKDGRFRAHVMHFLERQPKPLTLVVEAHWGWEGR